MKRTIYSLILYLILNFCLFQPSFAQEERIVGGQPVTNPAKYPWIAAIVYSDVDSIYDGQTCGGTLIAPDWVVTAAHCVCDSPDDVYYPKDIDVILGAVDLKAEPDSYERIEVARIFVNSNYDPYWSDNDVALLKLKTNSNQKPIEFLAAKESDPTLNMTSSDSIMATVIGWGDTEAQKYRSSYPNQLQEVDLPLVSNQECSSFFGEGEITDNMLCAGFVEGGKDSCFGDSGGPLVIPYLEGGNSGYNLIGIVSWGSGCAQPNTYGVYTRVSKMRDWIFEQIKSANAPVVLTNSTPTTIYSGSDLTVYGWSGINNINIERGACVKLINFPNINIITIQGDSSYFAASRSGATVTFKDETNETTVIMPATKNPQLIIFDNITTNLQIESNKVMLGKYEVTNSPSPF